MSSSSDRLLEIYLADHLAAATAGVELVHRAARSNAGNDFDEPLRKLGLEIEEDRQTLRGIIAGLGFKESRVKELLAWSGEKVGRLKLNGQIRGYSPLSRVLELEALSVGIAGKLALWQSLQSVPGIAPRLPHIDLAHLAERARRQRDEVEEQRVRAAREAFGNL